MYDIIIVDDHALFRSGLKGLLEADGGFRIVGEAGNGAEFLAMLPPESPAVVLMDLDMPQLGGEQATAKALAIDPCMKIITLSMHGQQEYYFRMVGLGVKGFLLKNSEIAEVKMAIKTVADGGTYFSQELLRDLVGNLRPGAEEPVGQLSEREKEVLVLICQGRSNIEIAEKLFISKRTVENHRASILDKTGTANTANLVVYAIKNGLVEL